MFRSTLLHLRIPFSFFLMPVYFFALAISPNFNEPRIIWSFLIIHLLLYPASNGYNSYFDKDENSIGGLKNPPPVNRGLYFTSLAFDGLAIVLGLSISLLFSVMLFLYGLASKAYSHPLIRLKKYPTIGLLTIGFFQGLFAFLMSYEGINGMGLYSLTKPQVYLAGLLTTLMLLGSYPMTQIFQHEEDSKRGDKTLSVMLGVTGTFAFTAIVFTLAVAAFMWFLARFYGSTYVVAYLLFLLPVLIYFLIWFYYSYKDGKKADYNRTMWLNFISAACLSGFFIFLFLDTSQVIQAVKGGF